MAENLKQSGGRRIVSQTEAEAVQSKAGVDSIQRSRAVKPARERKSVNRREFMAYATAGSLALLTALGLGTMVSPNNNDDLVKQLPGANSTIVPYKGSGPAMTGLLSGEVNGSMTTLVTSIPHIKAGRLRPIGVTTAQRSRALPDVPSISETVPGYDVVHWYGMWGPKGLPKNIVMLWNREVAKILRTPANEKWLQDQGLERAGGPPEEYAERLGIDVAKWKRVVKEAHLKFN